MPHNNKSTYLPHGNVIQAIWTVEHHTPNCEGFGQIFDCFCLACSGRALQSTVQMQMISADQSAVAAVSQRRDDQPRTVTQIFISIIDCGTEDADLDTIFQIVPTINHYMWFLRTHNIHWTCSATYWHLEGTTASHPRREAKLWAFRTVLTSVISWNQ